jgi:hypothetical protein
MNQVIVTAAKFGKVSLDKNGKQAIILLPVAGSMPNRNILAGTTAERSGFEEGKSYLATVRETEVSAEYGRQFQWTKVFEVTSPLEVIKATKELGEGHIYNVTSNEEAAQATPATATTSLAD